MKIAGLLILALVAAAAAKHVQLSGVSITVEEPTSQKVYDTDEKLKHSIMVTGDDMLLVRFTVTDEDGESVAPHQAFLRLTNQDTDKQVFFVGSHEGQGKHLVELNMNDRSSMQYFADNGEYAMDIIVGDEEIENPTLTRIAIVEINLPTPQKKKDEPLYSKPLLHESDTARKPMPIIEHEFQKPEKRPNQLISYVFVGLVALPMVVLIVLLAGKVNFDAIPSGFGLVWAGVFTFSLLSVLLLLAAFWVRLNMFQTLFGLTPLAFVTFVSFFFLQKKLASAKSKTE